MSVHGFHQPVQGIGCAVRLWLVKMEKPLSAFLAQLDQVFPHGACRDVFQRPCFEPPKALGHRALVFGTVAFPNLFRCFEEQFFQFHHRPVSHFKPCMQKALDDGNSFPQAAPGFLSGCLCIRVDGVKRKAAKDPM